MELPVIYSQRDPRWAKWQLGRSDLTIGSHGCLIASYATVLEYYGISATPKSLDIALTKINGYTPGGSLYWGSIKKLYPDMEQDVVDARSRLLTDAEKDEILAAIKNRQPVIIQVDMIPATSKADMHFVVGYQYNDKQLVIADPWTGQSYGISSKYGMAWTLNRAIYRYIILKPKVKPADQPTYQDLLDEIAKLKAELAAIQGKTPTPVKGFAL